MNMLNTGTYIYKELKKRGVTVEVIDDRYSFMRYRYKRQWHYLRGCVTEGVSVISQLASANKDISEQFAKKAGLPVPASMNYESFEQATRFMERYGSIVVKPVDGAQGNGITVGVTTKTELKKALSRVKKFSKKPPLLQQFVQGKDVRILVIDGAFCAAVRRVPASVIGDGKHTIEELIVKENSSGERSAGKRGRLKVINFDAAKTYLKKRLGRVPKKDEIVPVVGLGNTSMGGHAEDFTERLPAAICKQAEKLTKELRLPVCGVDIMLDDETNEYFFIEANSSPGFGPHHHPRFGEPRRVVEPFVDMLLK